MDTPDAQRSGTLDDIRTAFLLGWSLVELKSRVLISIPISLGPLGRIEGLLKSTFVSLLECICLLI